MKELKYLMIHCSATPEGRNVQPKDIIKMHTSPPPTGRGWKVVGYSRVITLDGVNHLLRNYNEDNWVQSNEITNGAAGYNNVSRHICYIGGVDNNMKAKDTRTAAQKKALESYVKNMIKKYPKIKVIGHNQVSSKDCPSFNVPTWLKSINVASINIGL